MLKRLKSLIGNRNPLRILWYKNKAFFAALRYGFPARKLCIVAITGTDGKTTTVGMTAHILRKAGFRVGAASTAFLQIDDITEENATHLTSISPFELQRFLRTLVRKGCEYAVIEMSSHGLVQGRVSYTWPLVSGITNTALEHLDYHGSMEQYRKDKGIIFQMLKGKGVKVLNAADESVELFRKIPSIITVEYGTDSSDIYVKAIEANSKSCRATVVSGRQEFPLGLSIPGTFNLENAMCAMACAKALGVSERKSIDALQSFTALPGRMERIDEGQDFSVFVDFAVSPQSYEKGLEALRKIVGTQGRVMVLCSSCGNRMEEKRPIIGKICSAMADIVVATEDETYGEDPHKVLEEVWAGIDQSACEAHKIFDRREAIEFLCKNARSGDAIILCGMGPFSTFTKLEGRIPWDERVVAREVLQAL
ncbi:MAG: UDP-N-acetylmuramyl-tripeptide synthetase [Candidatus Peribacter sp.]|jgi:UDP-N-acetylmuramoyl-L-alanyl-D-glutamate--2,6-diaminopimelate ligase|nr:UDP-N-acetylmuramyl-tripeptide synthetase [Candidatus Peribacter sp.]MBT4393526.1 UDP-N-acetylmuramyl-tripeptide synthetase [Candidatus Peribacter sp.]MBT5149306.1 UDP-N-acetylmuramyl-tripeptide synthetase [Candidatus Peribacter sp.]MBT5938065.1 UDP-N-acetylmuramyl-tripeptide synthetase [Candidatus Peribacter sp.]MBT6823150.1 UDP-N-acetylmuramyl-tripeptide synthetase [Candidatus Peribacter sp.]